MTPPPHRRPGRTGNRPALSTTPLAVGAAGEAGWSEAALRHGISTGDVERLQRGVVVARHSDLPVTGARAALERANLKRAQGAVVACPRAAISHVSAAIAHGLPTLGDLSRSCLTVQSGTALRRLARVHLHRATLPDSIPTVGGYPVLDAARTAMDLARERGVDHAVVAADFALHTGLVTPEELSAAFDLCAGWPGRHAARIAYLTADGAAESPLESLSRLRILGSGLPRPSLQPEICDLTGRFLARCDFYWDEFGVVGEADGNLKYERGREAIIAERERQALLEAAGLIVVRWGWRDLATFDRVVARLWAAFARGTRAGAGQREWGLLSPNVPLHS